MSMSKPWLLAFLLPLSLQGTRAQPSCRTKADCGEGQFCRFPDGGCVAPGACQEIPFVCTMDYRPVCGCDGKTYGNRCGASGAGMSVRVEGECTPSSPASSSSGPSLVGHGKEEEEAGKEGGRKGGRQKRDLMYMEGWIGGEETLLLRVEKAISSSSSSSSSVGAAAAAAGIFPSLQEPEPEKQQQQEQRKCGSRGLAPCLAGEWCDFIDGTCGETDKGGVCTKVQLGCNRMYMPVCGCDGQTHPSACMAHAEQVSVRHEGACTPQASSALPSSVSSTEEEAAAAMGTGAGATPAVALEKQKDVQVEKEEEEKTLSLPPPPPSAPIAPPTSSSSPASTPPSSHSSLTDVWQAGGGASSSTTTSSSSNSNNSNSGSNSSTACGGLQGLSCPRGQACIFPRGTCGAADEMGTCLPPPFICALIYQPVCGCNGQTFSNECYAHASAVSVSSQGPCPPPTPATGADPASPALQQDDVSTTHAEATAAAAAAVAAAVAAAEAIANGANTGAPPAAAAAAGGGAAAAPAATQKDVVEEEYLRGGHRRRG